MSQRPLFDPDRIRPPAEARSGNPPDSGTYTVRQVNELVRGALARHLPATLHVLGEVGDVSRPASGHLYFTLKDTGNELACVMWRSAATRVRFELQPGMEVIVTGFIEVYAPRGTYQLSVRRLEPRGVGALELAFRQLKERLEGEGLFDPQRKRPLPPVPRCIAIVTSPAGAAIRDILQTLRRRFPALRVLVFPVRVQGEGAAGEIAAAIEQMNAHAAELGGIDAAIVGRGGGSLEDLWAFNEEVVARAIAASGIPIISAVGHEVDVSISDLVADVRAATPTAAAELIAPRLSDLLERLWQQVTRATRATRHALDLARARLGAALAYDGLARPLNRVQARAQRLDELTHRLAVAVRERQRLMRGRLERAELALLRFRAGAHFRRLSERLAEQVLRLHRALARPAMRGEQELALRLARLERAAPTRHLDRLEEQWHQVCRRLELAAGGVLKRDQRRLAARLEALAAYNPQQVLRRGYSITRDARTRRIIRSVEEIRAGLRTVTQLHDGEFHATADDPRQARLFD